jgi:hypothetical protein
MVQSETLINEHFSAIEKVLLAKAEIQNQVGHNLHKGTPREFFIKDFISEQIGDSLGYGTGEIIDFLSKPSEPRNQFDIVIYDRLYPILALGGGCSAFLVETVLATVEVKSCLTKDDLEKAMLAGSRLASLTVLPEVESSRMNTTPRRFLVAYSGPKNIETVFNWVKEIYSKHALKQEAGTPQCEFFSNKLDAIPRDRMRSNSLDGIFILGLGFILFDGFRFSLGTNYSPVAEQSFTPVQWSYGECETGALHLLFFALMDAVGDASGNKYRFLMYYAKKLKFNKLDHAAITCSSSL